MADREKNLIPMNQRTESEQRELSKKGGVASGAARRRKRAMKEAADLYLSLPVTDKRKRKAMERRALPVEDIDNQMAMIVGLVDAATKGDARAAAVVARLIGEERPTGENTALLDRARALLADLDALGTPDAGPAQGGPPGGPDDGTDD